MDPRFDFLEFRIYTRRVMWAVVFFGGIIFIGGLKWSGLDFEKLRGSSPTFKSGEHVCVKSAQLSSGQPGGETVEICIEWIDLGDTTGNTHHLNPENIQVSIGPEGEIGLIEKRKVNLPLLGAIIYLMSLVGVGNFIQAKLIKRRRQSILNKVSENQKESTENTRAL